MSDGLDNGPVMLIITADPDWPGEGRRVLRPFWSQICDISGDARCLKIGLHSPALTTHIVHIIHIMPQKMQISVCLSNEISSSRGLKLHCFDSVMSSRNANLCLSVRWKLSSSSRALKSSSFWLRSLLGLSQLFLSALLDYFVGQTEPKILRLVWDDCV